MYKTFGYSVYRQVLNYYSGDPPEDAYGNLLLKDKLTLTKKRTIFLFLLTFHFFFLLDMRKALPRDVYKKSIIPLPHPVKVDEVEQW